MTFSRTYKAMMISTALNSFCAPLPNASMVMTAATPMRIPSIERPLRTLLAAMPRMAEKEYSLNSAHNVSTSDRFSTFAFAGTLSIRLPRQGVE